MTVRMSRRRAIMVIAAAAGTPLLFRVGSAQAQLTRWQGTALGADASIQLYHHDQAAADAAIRDGLAELNRLEQMFSLFRADSLLRRLNDQGRVDGAPAEFVELLSLAKQAAQHSQGWFDPTVQPVWQLYMDHFTRGDARADGPAADRIAQAVALVDWQGLQISGDSVWLDRPGMGVTLNSVGQGYISDRVADVLRRHGFQNMLVDMGEPRALSTKPDGSAWRIGIANPASPSQAITEIDVVDQAVATSGGYGTLFDDAGRFTHLIRPRDGSTAAALAGVTVVADTAARANALSTALAVAPSHLRQSIIDAFGGGTTAYFVSPTGVDTVLKG